MNITESMEKAVKSLDPRLKIFVNKAMDLIHYNQFLEEFKRKGGHLDGYHLHVHLIQWFIHLEIEFNRERAPEYKHIRYVKDLPEKDIKECLFYLNYILGTSVYTGGHDYMKIYDKIIQSSGS